MTDMEAKARELAVQARMVLQLRVGYQALKAFGVEDIEECINWDSFDVLLRAFDHVFKEGMEAAAKVANTAEHHGKSATAAIREKI